MKALASSFIVLSCLASPLLAAAPPDRTETKLARFGLAPGHASVYARFEGQAEPFLDIDGGRTLRPASTMKLVSSACALAELGPARRFETRFLAKARPGADGTLAGSLHVVGGGNPRLRGEDLWAAVRELAALGLRRVEGDLVLDAGALSGGRPVAWPKKRGTKPYDADPGGLALAWNSTQLVFRPGGRSGTPATLDAFPLRAGLEVQSEVKTGPRQRLQISSTRPDGSAVRVRGSLPPGAAPARRWVRLGPPRQALGAALLELFEAEGIALGGMLRDGPAPADAVALVTHESAPLAELVAGINKYSNNFGAELLARHVAHERGSAVPDALSACLGELGVDPVGAVIADGSGYAAGNRLSARLLVELLESAREHPSWGPE